MPRTPNETSTDVSSGPLGDLWYKRICPAGPERVSAWQDIQVPA